MIESNHGLDYVESEDPHILAGLDDVGVDEDNQVQWQGTRAQWNEYERLCGEEAI